jgi:enoyl-CoA hydratase
MFGQPEVRLGLIPGFGGSQRLPRLVGKGRAFEMLLSGEQVSAESAREMGLVNRVVAQSELLPTAETLARKIIANGPIAVQYCLEAVHRGTEMTLSEGQFVEATMFGMCFATEDAEEGTEAFLEKREPNFKGK